MPYEFRDFVTASGSNAIDAWLSNQPVGVREEFASLFKNLAQLPRHLWRPQECTQLKGKFKSRGLYEFKIRLKRRTFYRLGAFFGPQPQWITLCEGWGHAESAGAQQRAMERTLKRKALVESGEARTVTHVY